MVSQLVQEMELLIECDASTHSLKELSQTKVQVTRVLQKIPAELHQETLAAPYAVREEWLSD